MNQSKRPFVLSLGLGLIVFMIFGLHRGESEAYYAGAVFAIILGLARLVSRACFPPLRRIILTVS
jgi:xanthosine utilization system XapX-like protein